MKNNFTIEINQPEDEAIISNGHAWFVIILTGTKLGYHVQGLAEKISYAYLYENYKIPPYDIEYIEWQAAWMNRQIAEDGKINEANKVSQQITKELGLSQISWITQSPNL